MNLKEKPPELERPQLLGLTAGHQRMNNSRLMKHTTLNTHPAPPTTPGLSFSKRGLYTIYK